MRVSGAWLTRPETQAVFAALASGGFQALAVGGCVRNALLGVPVDDVDIATDARPEAVIAAAETAGLKPVPTGIDHGTITVVSGGIGHEVTTFRADVETDGRRAVVRFSGDVAEDARRRDFTMNALYCDAAGHVTDPLGGLPDLLARRVRFIEDAETRIREDYLRTLRFFRFSAWYGDPEQGFDPEALDAIARTLDGLETLSRERVGHEMLKLLSAPDPAPAVAVMEQTGVLHRLLPGASAVALAPLVHLEGTVPPDPVRRLAALGRIDPDSLRLSKAQARRLEQMRDGAESGERAAVLGYRHGVEAGRDMALVQAALLGQPLPADLEADLTRGANALMPVTAQDLMPALTGAALGLALKQAEAAWIASDFSLPREALLRAARAGL